MMKGTPLVVAFLVGCIFVLLVGYLLIYVFNKYLKQRITFLRTKVKYKARQLKENSISRTSSSSLPAYRDVHRVHMEKSCNVRPLTYSYHPQFIENIPLRAASPAKDGSSSPTIQTKTIENKRKLLKRAKRVSSYPFFDQEKTSSSFESMDEKPSICTMHRVSGDVEFSVFYDMSWKGLIIAEINVKEIDILSLYLGTLLNIEIDLLDNENCTLCRSKDILKTNDLLKYFIDVTLHPSGVSLGRTQSKSVSEPKPDLGSFSCQIISSSFMYNAIVFKLFADISSQSVAIGQASYALTNQRINEHIQHSVPIKPITSKVVTEVCQRIGEIRLQLRHFLSTGIFSIFLHTISLQNDIARKNKDKKITISQQLYVGGNLRNTWEYNERAVNRNTVLFSQRYMCRLSVEEFQLMDLFLVVKIRRLGKNPIGHLHLGCHAEGKCNTKSLLELQPQEEFALLEGEPSVSFDPS